MIANVRSRITSFGQLLCCAASESLHSAKGTHGNPNLNCEIFSIPCFTAPRCCLIPSSKNLTVNKNSDCIRVMPEFRVL